MSVDKWYTKSEIMALLNITYEGKLYRQVKQGKIETKKEGRQAFYRVLDSEIANMIAVKQEQNASDTLQIKESQISELLTLLKEKDAQLAQKDSLLRQKESALLDAMARAHNYEKEFLMLQVEHNRLLPEAEVTRKERDHLKSELEMEQKKSFWQRLFGK